MIGELAGAAMGATPAGAALGAASGIAGGLMGDGNAPATSAATSGDAAQNLAFKNAFGDMGGTAMGGFGDFNFAPANAAGPGAKAATTSGSVSLPVVVGLVGLAVTLVLFATRNKG